MIYSAIISAVIFTLFVGYVWHNHGVLKSISDSYYHLKHKVLFTVALWGFSIFAVDALPTIWMLLAVIGICFVACTPDFKLKFVGSVHFASAVSGIIFGGIAITLVGYWYLFLIMLIGIIFLHLTVSNRTWWQEIYAFYIIITGLILHNL